MKPENPSFHAHHSPMGALASFTCGAHGAAGGMGLELTGPFPGSIAVGYQTPDGSLHRLPLFVPDEKSEADRYVGEGGGVARAAEVRISSLEREFKWATDTLRTPEIEFEIVTPFGALPDPATASAAELKFASCPAVHARVTFKNASEEAWRGFFGLGIEHRWSLLRDLEGCDLIGAMSQDSTGFATRTPGVKTFIDFSLEEAMAGESDRGNFLLGKLAGVTIDVPAGETVELDLALGFFRAGKATFNRDMSYFYTRHFTDLPDVLSYAMDHRGEFLALAEERDAELEATALNDEQKFLVAHSTRSYFGSTQWLWDGTASVWVVNEGEYLMMNTFDLTVDMLFFELRYNPWTVRNVLDQYVRDYSFIDEVFDPSDPETRHPGGLSFTHDMGVMNHWSPRGRSSYEVAGLDRLCFSHMTCEQLTNWVLCAGVYFARTKDEAFIRRHLKTLEACLESLQNREHYDPTRRNGLMNLESCRTEGGGEITTYDSLDHSLGQSRANIYLGGKIWASAVVLNNIFKQFDVTTQAQLAEDLAQRSATTITAGFNAELGYIPAVLEGDNQSAIIPAIEALVYPYECGLTDLVSEDGPYGDYIRVLKKHLTNIVKPGMCLYDDGGWKLSSSADNSWMSKIALCQYVARQVLGFDFGDGQYRADQAHARWEREGSKLQACSDQFRSGIAHGSLYYPRIVTSILWLKES
jgi:xylan 1,4-beta-xylosidase